MFTRELVVNPDTGLHAEVAHRLLRLAKSTDCPMYLSCLDGRAANLRNSLELLGLAIKPGDTVILIVRTPDSEIAESLIEQATAAIC